MSKSFAKEGLLLIGISGLCRCCERVHTSRDTASFQHMKTNYVELSRL